MNGQMNGWKHACNRERDRERTLINMTAEFVNTYIDTHVNRMQCGVL